MNVILILGLVLVVALGAGRLGDRFGIPQVVGYILVGLLLGEPGLGMLPWPREGSRRESLSLSAHRV